MAGRCQTTDFDATADECRQDCNETKKTR